MTIAARSSSEWPGPLRSLGTRPYPINDTACKNSDYISNFVYKNDTLQYILNSEGRARPVLNTANETRFVYDYFVKDHLGNVRSTVTAEPINFDYIASHEIAMAGVEQLVFDNIPNVRASKPGGGGSDIMAVRLNGGESDKRIGTAIMLHAMPGDRFTVSADAFYEGSYQQSTEEVGSDAIVQSLAAALMGGTTYEGVPVSELPDNARLASSILSNPSLPTTLSTLVDQTNNPDAPKAHLNILFFDENMRLIPQASSVTQVTQNNLNNANGWTVLTPTGTGGGPHPGAPGPGYVVIYVDNQSIGKDVWFDNIMVGHYTGTVQEESHYYPFGLTLQTDVQTPEVTKQEYKYNTKELEKSFGLEMYDYGARMYDPQLGMWHAVDPLAEKSRRWSPYTYAFDNPGRFIDPDGRNAVQVIDKENQTITVKAVYYVQTRKEFEGATINGYETKDLKVLNTIDDKLNKQEYSVTEGKYKGYKVQFDLQFKDGGALEDAKKSASEESFKGVPIGNTFTKGDGTKIRFFLPKTDENGQPTSRVGGVTADHKDVIMNSEKDGYPQRVHEIFHTFFFDHDDADNGIGSYYKQGSVNGKDINLLINNDQLKKVDSQ